MYIKEKRLKYALFFHRLPSIYCIFHKSIQPLYLFFKKYEEKEFRLFLFVFLSVHLKLKAFRPKGRNASFFILYYLFFII